MTFEGYIVAETDRALLFECHYWDGSEWLPRSQITILREEDTHEVRVVASPWICGQKRLEEFRERKTNADSQTVS